MSDFIDEQYEDKLRVMSSRHDVIGLKIYDKMDMHTYLILACWKLRILKPAKYNGLIHQMRWFGIITIKILLNKVQNCKNIFKKSGADLLHLRTDEDYVKILQQFFLRRK